MTIKSALFLLSIGITSTFMCGCQITKDYGYARPFQFQDPKMSNHDYSAANTSTNYFRHKYDVYLMENKTNEAKLERNAILSELMFMIDGAHGEFERNSKAIKSGADFFADLAVLGVNGAGTVVGGAETKAILSAIAGGITGSKLAVSKDILQEQAVEAIQAEMGASMKQRKAQIITSMTNSVEKYPLELGLADVANYYYDGTFARALQNMVQTAKEREKNADLAVQSAINPTNGVPAVTDTNTPAVKK